jgi:hypothetical protein
MKLNPAKPLLATRFKLSFDRKGRCDSFRKDQANELIGEWVWLIEATDGMNYPLYSGGGAYEIDKLRMRISKAEDLIKRLDDQEGSSHFPIKLTADILEFWASKYS